MGRGVGWILDEGQRAHLLEAFPPAYRHVIAHHVTLWGRDYAAPLPAPSRIALVGHADGGQGIECYVAEVDGETIRPDGSVFHVTWSIDPASGKTPKESNALLAAQGWSPIVEPVALITTPGYL